MLRGFKQKIAVNIPKKR